MYKSDIRVKSKIRFTQIVILKVNQRLFIFLRNLLAIRTLEKFGKLSPNTCKLFSRQKKFRISSQINTHEIFNNIYLGTRNISNVMPNAWRLKFKRIISYFVYEIVLFRGKHKNSKETIYYHKQIERNKTNTIFDFHDY